MFCINSKSMENNSNCSSKKFYLKFRKLFNLSNNWGKKKPNSTSVKNFNNLHFQNTSSNETNLAITAHKSVKLRCGPEEKTLETSCLFCKDSLHHVYQILFTTCNVKLNPIFLATRNIPDFGNDKQTVTTNRMKFKETCDFKGDHGWITNRIFLLIKGRNKIGCISGISDIHPIKIYNTKKKEKIKKTLNEKSICSTQKFPDPNGKITLLANGVVFQIQCNILTLDSIRNRMVDHCGSRYSTIEPGVVQNHATITAKYRRDLIQFRFELVNVTIQPTIFKVSRACQVVDSQRFIPYFNNITSRKVFIPVPRMKMKYKDPINKIRSHMMSFDPFWLKAVRKQRIEKFKCKSNVNKSKNNKVHSTMISAENGGIIYKIRAGMLRVNIKDLSAYESFVIDRQRKLLAKKWEKIRNNDKENLISDWNLEIGDL